MVRSPDGDTSFFDITTGVLHGDKLAQFICIIFINYILKKSVDNNLRDLHPRLHSCKRKSNRYPDVHITDIDYADDIAVIINSLIDANKLLNKCEDTAKDIGLHIQSDKTEYMCLNNENQINMKSLSCHYIKRVE